MENLTYHHGPVMKTVDVYTIFWTPPDGLDQVFRDLINRYIFDVGAEPSDFLKINSQYFMATVPEFIRPVTTLAGSAIDSRPYSFCVNLEPITYRSCSVNQDCDSLPGSGDGQCVMKGSVNEPLRQEEIAAELRQVILEQGWGPPGLDRAYFIYTAPGIESTAGTACTPGVHCANQFCAYHSYLDLPPYTDKAIYAYMPYVETQSQDWLGCVVSASSPNNYHQADTVISMTSHEHFEAMTDPLLDAWYAVDLSGENGDKCRTQVGKIDPLKGANVVLNDHPYLVQEEWSNVDFDGVTGEGGCVKRFHATRFGVRPQSGPIDPRDGVLHFRGRCSLGTIGASCNTATDCGAGGACSVTAATADDTTIINWYDPDLEEGDLYRGTIAGNNRGSLSAGARPDEVSRWSMNTYANGSGEARCFRSDVAGVEVDVGMNYTTGVLSQADDADPPVGSVTYYLATVTASEGLSVAHRLNLGCANPGLCNNTGWCIYGASPGIHCNDDSACGGGICEKKPTFCSSDVGVAGFGGCAQHQTCAGGVNAGRLCVANSDCPGSTCTPLPATTNSPGQLCLINKPGDVVDANGCRNRSQPQHVIRVASAICAAPASSLGRACSRDSDCSTAPEAGDGVCGASRGCP